jgi:hypothetical protein
MLLHAWLLPHMGETSLLWATDADCVDLSRMPASDAPEPHFAMGDEVETSDRRADEQMVADLVELMGIKSEELLDDYTKSQPKQTPLTFDHVEVIWETEIRPALKAFASIQSGTDSPPEDSRWYANWRVPDRG